MKNFYDGVRHRTQPLTDVTGYAKNAKRPEPLTAPTVSVHSKKALAMPDDKLSRQWLNFKDEDYSNSACLLLPRQQATLIDADAFEWAIRHDWNCLGRSVFYVTRTPVLYVTRRWVGGRTQRCRIPASSTMTSLHREIFLMGFTGNDHWNVSQLLHRREVDHINRNPWDNRRVNLRMATHSQNMWNVAKRANCSSEYKGVCKIKGKNRWTANARVKGKTHHLGIFDNELSAAIAYNRFVEEKCGEFAYLNPITTSSSDEPTRIPSRRGRPRKPPPVVTSGESGVEQMTGLEAFRQAMMLESQRKRKPPATK